MEEWRVWQEVTGRLAFDLTAVAMGERSGLLQRRMSTQDGCGCSRVLDEVAQGHLALQLRCRGTDGAG